MAYWLIAGSKGGRNRVRIIHALEKTPMNLNRLAEKLGLDYKTVQHHLDMLLENGFLDYAGERYGRVFFPSEEFKAHKGMLKDMMEKVMDK